MTVEYKKKVAIVFLDSEVRNPDGRAGSSARVGSSPVKLNTGSRVSEPL